MMNFISMQSVKRLALGHAMVLLLVGSGFIAAAEDATRVIPAAMQPKSMEGVVEELIVTARRNTESLMDVPITVSNFTSDDIEDLNLDSLYNLQFQVPGLVFGGYNNSSNITLRGVGSDVLFLNEPGIGVYLDDVYLGSSVLGWLDYPGLSRIEVLRGPQGTLYGHNNIGGTIKMYTPIPDEFSYSNVDLQVTNHTGFQGKAILSGGSANMASNLMVHGTARKIGYRLNEGTGNDLDAFKSTTARTSVVFNDDDNLTRLIIRAGGTEQTGEQVLLLTEGGARLGLTPNTNPRRVRLDGAHEPYRKISNWDISLTLESEIEGGSRFRLISAVRSERLNAYGDTDGSVSSGITTAGANQFVCDLVGGVVSGTSCDTSAVDFTNPDTLSALGDRFGGALSQLPPVLASAITRTTAGIQAASAGVDDLNNGIAGVNAGIAPLESIPEATRTTEQMAQLAALRSQKTGLEMQLSTLQGQLTGLQTFSTDLSTLGTDLPTLQNPASANYQAAFAQTLTTIPSILGDTGQQYQLWLNRGRLESHQSTHEFSFLGQYAGFDYVAGIYLLNRRLRQEENYMQSIGSITLPNASNIEVSFRTWAMFMHTGWQFTDTFRSSFGIRRNYNHQSAKQRRYFLSTTNQCSTQRHKSNWQLSSAQFSLEFTPSDTSLIYLASSKAHKPGGYNLANCYQVYNPESVRNVELGFKGNNDSGDVRVNFSLFSADYQKYQASSFENLTYNVRNSIDGRTRGAEMQVTWETNPDFSLYFNIAYLNAIVVKEREVLADIVSGAPLRAADRENNLPRSPKYTSSIRLLYHWQAGESMNGKMNLSHRQSSHYYFDIANDRSSRQESYKISALDVSLTPDHALSDWTLGFFINNIEDVDLLVSSNRTATLDGTVSSYGEPRTYGIYLRRGLERAQERAQDY